MLQNRPFDVQTAGLRPHRVRATDLWMPTRGVRLPSESRDVEDLCHAYALALPPSAAFSFGTAARLWGIPLPSRFDAAIHATVPAGTRAPRRRGLRGHQAELPDDDVRVTRGIRITSPERTLLDLAPTLDLVALVAAADRITSRRMPLATAEALLARIREATGARGVKLARLALELMDGGSESPKESELRLLLLDAGLGPFLTNVEVRDSDGRFVARVDLAMPHLRIAVEYEGDHHRDRDQWRRDLARRRRLEAMGWIYIPVTQADLHACSAILADVAAAIRRRS